MLSRLQIVIGCDNNDHGLESYTIIAMAVAFLSKECRIIS